MELIHGLLMASFGVIAAELLKRLCVWMVFHGLSKTGVYEFGNRRIVGRVETKEFPRKDGL